MTTKERYSNILSWFRENRPEARTELHYGSPFQLLVSTMLSAQCTDKRVNSVTPALFKRFPTPASMSAATFEEVFPYVKSISYPNSKTTHIIAASRMIVEKFGGEVPSDISALMSLPGVGRKTANVVTSIIWNEPVIAVDTHVFRVSRRLGLSDGKTPATVEKDLEQNFPIGDRARAHHWLILHGRYTCTARAPHCSSCPLSQWCRYFEEKRREG